MEQIIPLTPNEKRILEFVQAFMAEQGVAPTFRQIKEHFGFASYNSVQRYLKKLHEKAYIHLPGGNQKRAISLLRPADALKESLAAARSDFPARNINSSAVSTPIKVPVSDGPRQELLSLPLLGRVAAGVPIEEYEHEEFVEVPPSMVRDAGRSFTLKVKGNSMIEDGIFDGDVIIVQSQNVARNGEICVAVVNNEATVKRYYLHRGERLALPQVELRPSNSEMESMWYAPHEVEVRGIVVGLLRKF